MNKNLREKKKLIIKKLFKYSIYSLDDALDLLLYFKNLKFSEMIEAHLNFKLLKIMNSLKINLVLPHPLEKSIKIAVFDDEKYSTEYIALGATYVGLDSLYNNIQNNLINFDLLITKPIYMVKLVKLSRFLVSKGLMPSLANNTLTNDIKWSLLNLKKFETKYQFDKTNNIHVNIGKTFFLKSELKANLLTFFQSIKTNILNNKKNTLKSFSICTTMSPSIKLNLNNLSTYLL